MSFIVVAGCGLLVALLAGMVLEEIITSKRHTERSNIPSLDAW